MFYNLLKNLLKAAITLAKHFLPRHAGGILGHFAISSGLRQATEKKKKKGFFFFFQHHCSCQTNQPFSQSCFFLIVSYFLLCAAADKVRVDKILKWKKMHTSKKQDQTWFNKCNQQKLAGSCQKCGFGNGLGFRDSSDPEAFSGTHYQHSGCFSTFLFLPTLKSAFSKVCFCYQHSQKKEKSCLTSLSDCCCRYEAASTLMSGVGCVHLFVWAEDHVCVVSTVGTDPVFHWLYSEMNPSHLSPSATLC